MDPTWYRQTQVETEVDPSGNSVEPIFIHELSFSYIAIGAFLGISVVAILGGIIYCMFRQFMESTIGMCCGPNSRRQRRHRVDVMNVRSSSVNSYVLLFHGSDALSRRLLRYGGDNMQPPEGPKLSIIDSSFIPPPRRVRPGEESSNSSGSLNGQAGSSNEGPKDINAEPSTSGEPSTSTEHSKVTKGKSKAENGEPSTSQQITIGITQEPSTSSAHLPKPNPPPKQLEDIQLDERGSVEMKPRKPEPWETRV